MSSFENTPQFQHMIGMRSACSRVLREVFRVTDADIVRYSNSSKTHVLDRQAAINVRVKLRSGMQLVGHERTHGQDKQAYQTLCLEFWDDRHHRVEGEWFRIACQFYLTGYSDASGKEFAEWKLFNMASLAVWLGRWSIDSLAERTKASGPSRAAFLPIPFDCIPDYCLFAHGGGPGDTVINKFKLDSIQEVDKVECGT